MAEGLKNEDFTIRTGSLDDPDEGLSEEILNDTDVLLWWGHIAHEEVSDGLVDRIQQRVLARHGTSRPPFRAPLETVPST